MFAKCRGCLDIEVVEGNDAIDDLGLRKMADAKQNILELPRFVDIGDVEDVVERLARPVRVLETGGS